MTVMDIKKLQGILMSKGIRIADNDPIFTLVALNEALLDDMAQKHQQMLNSMRIPALAESATQSHCFAKKQASVSTLNGLLLGVLAFGAGNLLGSHETPMFLASLGLVLGLMIGLIVTVLLIIRMEQRELSMASKSDKEQRLKALAKFREGMADDIKKALEEGRTKSK